MTSDDVVLKPCPFCGGEGEVSYYATAKSPEPAGYFVECTTCAASGEGVAIQGEMPDRVEYTKATAITAWNTRASPSASADRGGLREKVARIEDLLDGADLLGGYLEDDASDAELGRRFISARHDVRAILAAVQPPALLNQTEER